ncbi:MAG TPA: sigma-70 family RNA polymerase sigma factor [Gemmataceae bacterium]|nr:sigma-70 family RNA polymerase sigma factor [Gemmataceae bacterium]
MTRTPASLLERLRQAHAPEAWERLVLLYTPLIYSWARQAGLQEADAADLVQDVFVTLVQTLPAFDYDRHKSFRGWLRTITLNKWRDRQRKRARQPVPSDAALLEDPAPAANNEHFWEVEYRQHLVNRALAIMSRDFQPATWKAFWEQAVEGRPAAEVAAELKLTIGAAYAAKLRVLDRLREEMAGMLD